MNDGHIIKDTANYPVDIHELLRVTLETGASDLHLAVGAPPLVRVHGELVELDFPVLSSSNVDYLIIPVLEPSQKTAFESQWELDFSYSVPGLSRFRGNIMRQRGSISLVFRTIPFEVPDIDLLGLPPEVKKICNQSRGLVLVTGPTGSGKSTTLASMIDYINRNRRLNIVTIEDPIEFLYKHRKSTIRQREIGSDTYSFDNALKHVLRHDPDVILIGEMRDINSISIALTAAETGHLVLSTLHTQTAPLTISRIIDVFQGSRREQVRQQLSNTLRAVISQQLIRTEDGKGRVLAVELLMDTLAVRNMIREGKTHQIYSAMQTGQSHGMYTMDQSLARLFLLGKISRQSALDSCIDKDELNRTMQRV